MISTLRRMLGLSASNESPVDAEQGHDGGSTATSSPSPDGHTEGPGPLRSQSDEGRRHAEKAAYDQHMEHTFNEQERVLSRVRRERNDAQATSVAARQAHDELTLAYNDLEWKMRQLRSEHERVTASHNQLLQEHDQVAAQLRSAKALMGTHDEVSTEEILQLVKDINAVISQLASALSDGVQRAQEQLENPDSAKDSSESGVSRASARLRPFLSDSFIYELYARDNAEDNILVQYGIRSCLAYHICRGTRQFHANLSSGRNTFLIKLFGKIQTSASQAVAAHWRSLTYSACEDVVSDSQNSQFNDEIITDINALFELAHCTMATSSWEQRVVSLLDTATQLSSIIQQKAYSKSYFATFLAPGNRFEPERMQDVLKSQPHRLHSPVCCTVALGLAYTIHPKDGPVQRVQILLSEVVQQQTLNELLDD